MHQIGAHNSNASPPAVLSALSDCFLTDGVAIAGVSTAVTAAATARAGALLSAVDGT